jgi:medium-chain acyl-[acyl-carrier-protein] hydrolase
VAAVKEGASAWLVYPEPDRQAPVRLFCFPYAGGGPASYQEWSQQLGEQVEVCVVQLPGQGARAAELPLNTVEDIVAGLLPALQPHLTKPFAFFGHDLGAIIMFEVARALRQAGARLPAHLFASSAIAPQLYYFAPIHMLPQQRFFDTVSAFDFPAVPAAEQASRLPAIRADFAAMANYRYQPGAPFSCPITALLADRDILAPHNGIDAWRAQTEGQFTKHLLAGTHYFLNDDRAPLLGIITSALAAALEG